MVLRTLSTLLVGLLVTTTAVLSERLSPDLVESLGYFMLPDEEGPGDSRTYEFFGGGLSVVADCLGRQDPSPDDGFPGCLMALGHRNARSTVGVFDIAAPGGQSESVVPIWDLLGTYMMDRFSEAHPQIDGQRERLFDVLYLNEGDCRIWWLYVQHYGNSMQDDTPFVGFSSCDPKEPDPRGGWALPVKRNRFGRNALHPNKSGRSVAALPAESADLYFGGQRLILAAGKARGSRESSAGPSFAIADLVDAQGEYLENARPLVYYPHPLSRKAGRFPEWYEETAFDGYVSSCSDASGGELLRAETQSALVQVWSEAVTMEDGVYPRNPAGRARYDSDPLTPSTTDPVGWYGIDECTEGPAEHQQPSFWDKKRDGSQADKDCNMVSQCPGRGTGPRCNNVHNFLLFYDPEELAQAFRGKTDPWKIQPFARKDLGWHEEWRCQVEAAGTAYDRNGQILFIAQYAAEPRIHMYRVRATPRD